MNLIYPLPTEEPAIAGIGWVENHHLQDSVESVIRNTGELSENAKESERQENVSDPESSDVSVSSQRGHSTRRTGKPSAWGRATPGEAASSHYTECKGLGILADVGGTRTPEVLSWGRRVR